MTDLSRPAAGSAFAAIQSGLTTALPMAIGFVPLGLILGGQAIHLGMGSLTILMMTGFNFAGGSEFAAVALWSSVPPVVLIVFTTFLINSRHIVMGASLAPYLKDEPLWRIFVLYFFMCDETWALNIQEASRRKSAGLSPAFRTSYYFAIALFLYITWNGSIFIGASIASMIGDLNAWGFASACPATFIALTVGMWPKKGGLKKALPIITAGIAAFGTVFILDATWSVALGTITGLITAFFTTGKD